MREIKEHTASDIIYNMENMESDKSSYQQLELAPFGKTIAAVSQSVQNVDAFSLSEAVNQQRSGPGKWWGWCREFFQRRKKTIWDDENFSCQESRHTGRRLYFETARLLQAREAETVVSQPAFKLKGWCGLLLGAGALIGLGSTAYMGGQWYSHRREGRNHESFTPYARDNTVQPDFEAGLSFHNNFAPYAEKLQDPGPNVTMSASDQETRCELMEDLDACKDAYVFRKEAGLASSAKLTINKGDTRCVCPPDRTPFVADTEITTKRGHSTASDPRPPLCEFEEDIKGCHDAYRFRKEAGLDITTTLTLTTGKRRCICPPEENAGIVTSEKSMDALIDLAILADYSKVETEPQAPKILQNLVLTKQLRRDFYNRHFYPLLMKASDNLKKKSIIITERTLMKEVIVVISDVLGKLEQINLAHALRIDPLYNWLVLLVREIARETEGKITVAVNTQIINANRVIKKLNTIITPAGLDELQEECVELTRFYSDPENAHTETYISNKLKIVINYIMLLFRQAVSKLSDLDDGSYISDYLSAFFFNLDQDTCRKITPNKNIGKICTLYPEMGISLFKYKQKKYRKVAAILLADTVFIPRLREIMNAAHINLENRELRLIEKVICEFTGSVNPFFCENEKIYNMHYKANNKTEEADKNNLTPEEALDNYLALPVPFYGSAIGASGLGFAIGTGIMGHAAGNIRSGGINVIHSRPDISTLSTPLANRDDPGTIAGIKSDSNTHAESNINAGAPGGDLVRFPEIPAPLPGEADELLVLKPIAKKELKGKQFIIARGLTSDVSGEVPEYIRQAQAILRTNVEHTSEMVNSLWRTLRMRASDEAYMTYLRQYFRGALNTDNEQIINMAISRFKEIVERVRGFFNRSLRQKYSNIFIVSTRQTPSSFAGEYSSLLSEEELKDVPNAISFFSTEPTIAIFTDSSYLFNPEHDLIYRRTLTHDLSDTLTHEATHFARTRDYFYLPRTATGRSTNAQEAYKNIRLALENMGVEADLQAEILTFTRERNLPYPTDIMAFLDAYPVFRSYILMNSAEHLEIFIRDIARGMNFDSPAPL